MVNNVTKSTNGDSSLKAKPITSDQPTPSGVSESQPTATPAASNDHELHIVPNVLGSGAVSDGRTYSVSLIDKNKNRIPTGTKLFVKGTLYTVKWGPTDDCTWLLGRGTVPTQHGEADPRSYCRFSILLDERTQGGSDLWPSASLVCVVSPEEMKEVTHLYHYGDEVQVSGDYGNSLDFEVVPMDMIGGGHFGVSGFGELHRCQ